MLTQSDFTNIEKQASALYESLELEIIEEIATRIARVGYANTVVLNDTRIAQEMGHTDKFLKIVVFIAMGKYTVQHGVSGIEWTKPIGRFLKKRETFKP